MSFSFVILFMVIKMSIISMRLLSWRAGGCMTKKGRVFGLSLVLAFLDFFLVMVIILVWVSMFVSDLYEDIST